MTTTDVRNPFVHRAISLEAVQEELDALFRLDSEDAGELLLVRHAEPARPAGSDPLLSCVGLEQAERLAERLSPFWVETVYTAPERRAVQTATVLAGLLDRPHVVLEGLRDIEFDAVAASQCHESALSAAERFVAQPLWDSVPGFGSSRAFRLRAIQAIEGAIACNPARRIVVVTHGSVINAYLSMILSVPGDQFFSPAFSSISVVRWCEDRYAVRSLNDVSHLGRAGTQLGVGGDVLPAVDCR